MREVFEIYLNIRYKDKIITNSDSVYVRDPIWYEQKFVFMLYGLGSTIIIKDIAYG